MKYLDKLLNVLCLALYALGAIGGVGCALFNREYVIAFGVIVLAVEAYPFAEECWRELNN